MDNLPYRIQRDLYRQSQERAATEAATAATAQAVDSCLEELLRAANEERARAENRLRATHDVLSRVSSEGRVLDGMRALERKPLPPQLRSPRSVAKTLQKERARRADLLHEFTDEVALLKERSDTELARSRANMRWLHERLATAQGVPAREAYATVPSREAAELEAERFVELAMHAAEQRLRVQTPPLAPMKYLEVLSP